LLRTYIKMTTHNSKQGPFTNTGDIIPSQRKPRSIHIIRQSDMSEMWDDYGSLDDFFVWHQDTDGWFNVTWMSH